VSQFSCGGNSCNRPIVEYVMKKDTASAMVSGAIVLLWILFVAHMIVQMVEDGWPW